MDAVVESVKEEYRKKKLKTVCLPPNYLSLKGWRVKNPKWKKKKKKRAKERISYFLVFTSSTYTNQRLINSLGSHSGLLHTFANRKDRNFKLLPCSKPEPWCYLLLMPTRNLIWVRSLFWFCLIFGSPDLGEMSLWVMFWAWHPGYNLYFYHSLCPGIVWMESWLCWLLILSLLRLIFWQF